MTDNKRIGSIELFAPIKISWDHEKQELEIHGLMVVHQHDPVNLSFFLKGDAAIQSLTAFRSLLELVDIETLSKTKPSDLQ